MTTAVRKRIVLDIETDGLDATTIWVCVCMDLDSKQLYVFHDTEEERLQCKQLLESADIVIGHNVINFDLPVLHRLWDVDIPVQRVRDTLVMSRLAKQSREGGHSLASLSQTTEDQKGHHEDWSQWSQEMEDYCKQDVIVTAEVYSKVAKELQNFSKDSVKIEHWSQYLLQRQQDNGFLLNIEEAIRLRSILDEEYMSLIEELRRTFPDRKVYGEEYVLRYSKDGKLHKACQRMIDEGKVEKKEDKYYYVEMREFCIDSPKEIAERLSPYWNPIYYTPKGQPKVCIENIVTVPPTAPSSIQKIVRCKVLKSRSTLIESFLKSLGKDGRVHGQVMSIGSITHRMAHRNPNTANIPSRGLYGKECRRLFICRKGYKIVGCDASGIQLRALAHYVNDKELIHQILNEDIHVYLAKAYGLMSEDVVYNEKEKELEKARSTGKTITYAILMGAGAAKIGSIAGGDTSKGYAIMKGLEKKIKGWNKFKREIAYRAAFGSFRALDGRLVELKSAHFGMSAYLQSFEQAIMKRAMITANHRLEKLGLDFKQVAVVHDEIQYEVREDQAEELGKVVRQCIVDAGEYYKVLCPLDGEYKIGDNWAESH